MQTKKDSARYETGERQQRGIHRIAYSQVQRLQSLAFANLFSAGEARARRIHQRECPTTHLAKRAEKNPPTGKKCTGEELLLFSYNAEGTRVFAEKAIASGASRRI